MSNPIIQAINENKVDEIDLSNIKLSSRSISILIQNLIKLIQKT